VGDPTNPTRLLGFAIGASDTAYEDTGKNFGELAVEVGVIPLPFTGDGDNKDSPENCLLRGTGTGSSMSENDVGLNCLVFASRGGDSSSVDSFGTGRGANTASSWGGGTGAYKGDCGVITRASPCDGEFTEGDSGVITLTIGGGLG